MFEVWLNLTKSKIMKKSILSACFAFVGLLSVVAKDLPTDILDANIGLVYYEFSPDENRDANLKEARTLLEEKGYNIVSMHHVTDIIDADVAVADMDYKKVKYIIKVVAKPPMYTMFLLENKDKLDRTFKEKTNNQLIIEAAASIENVVKKVDKRYNSYRKKGLLTNSVDYDRTWADKILISDEAKNKLAILNEKRSHVKYISETIVDSIPLDIKTSKVAFVKFCKEDYIYMLKASNNCICNVLKKSSLNYEIFETYEDYANRKDEFKYRIVLTKSIGGGGPLIKTSYNNITGGWETKNFINSPQVPMYITLLRDEQDSQIYNCSKCKIPSLINKSIKIFVESVE